MYVFCIPDASPGAVPAALLQILPLPDCAQTRHTCHHHSACKPFSIKRLHTLSITNRGGGCAQPPSPQVLLQLAPSSLASFDLQPSTFKVTIRRSESKDLSSPVSTLQRPPFLPPTAHKPCTPVTITPPANSSLSIACARFPSHPAAPQPARSFRAKRDLCAIGGFFPMKSLFGSRFWYGMRLWEEATDPKASGVFSLVLTGQVPRQPRGAGVLPRALPESSAGIGYTEPAKSLLLPK